VERTVRDTIYKPLEQAQQVYGVTVSHLETDFAESDAAIDSSGLLNHSIRNKDSIPTKYIELKTTVRDSIPYPVEVEVPGQPVTTKVPVRGFFWWIGLISFLGAIAYSIYKIRSWSPAKAFIKKLFKIE
jgi:hypothetical protein